MWGSCGIFVRTLIDAGMDSITLLESRVWIGFVIMAVILLIYDKSLMKIRLKDWWIFAGASILGAFALNICYNESINQVTLSLAAVLLGMAPFFVLIFAAILFKEKLTLHKIICMVLALAGCVLVSGILESSSDLKWTPAGIIIGILSAIFYALYSVFSRVAMDRSYHPLTVTFYSFGILAVVAAPFTDWGTIGTYFAAAPVHNGLFMVAHAICITVMPYVLYTISLNCMEAGKASILASAEPVAAMVFGVIFYKEIPTVLSLIGLVMTLAALAALSFKK